MRPDVGRPPTSHERMSGQPWDASYYDGPAPWDVGRPQPAVARLALEGGFPGSVLDAGCGTGENSLLVAALGLPVLGVDVAETALSMAREKAASRGIAAEFAWADALRLERLERRFDSVLDCGLFHSFDGDERPEYVASLASVTGRGAPSTCSASATSDPIPARTRSAGTSWRRRSAPAAGGASPPSTRTGCSPASTMSAARPPGWRRSPGSRLPGWPPRPGRRPAGAPAGCGRRCGPSPEPAAARLRTAAAARPGCRRGQDDERCPNRANRS